MGLGPHAPPPKIRPWSVLVCLSAVDDTILILDCLACVERVTGAASHVTNGSLEKVIICDGNKHAETDCCAKPTVTADLCLSASS